MKIHLRYHHRFSCSSSSSSTFSQFISIQKANIRWENITTTNSIFISILSISEKLSLLLTSTMSNSRYLIRSTNIRELQKQLIFHWELPLLNICISSMAISRYLSIHHKFHLWDHCNISPLLTINLSLSIITLTTPSHSNSCFTIQGFLISLITIVIPLRSNCNTKRESNTITSNPLSSSLTSRKFRIDSIIQLT